MDGLNYDMIIPDMPLCMLRVFYPTGIQFKYIMYNENTSKYNIVNFTRNIIEPGEYDTIGEITDTLNKMLESEEIKAYQKI